MLSPKTLSQILFLSSALVVLGSVAARAEDQRPSPHFPEGRSYFRYSLSRGPEQCASMLHLFGARLNSFYQVEALFYGSSKKGQGIIDEFQYDMGRATVQGFDYDGLNIKRDFPYLGTPSSKDSSIRRKLLVKLSENDNEVLLESEMRFVDQTGIFIPALYPTKQITRRTERFIGAGQSFMVYAFNERTEMRTPLKDGVSSSWLVRGHECEYSKIEP